MRWSDVQEYFRRVVERSRSDAATETPDSSEETFRFAAMCMLLGLDPEEGRRRIRALDHRHLQPSPARRSLFGA
jgi:hypothetical protein